MSGKSSLSGGLAGSCVGSGGVGVAIGICIPGVITCPGDGEGLVIGIPGVCTCGDIGEGEAVGICIPGVITCAGEGEGFGLVALLAGGRLARGAAFLFLGALFGFGFMLDMSCCSCCGSAVAVTANINANMPTVRSPSLMVPIQFIKSPLFKSARANARMLLLKKGRARQDRPMPVPSVTSRVVDRLNAEDVD